MEVHITQYMRPSGRKMDVTAVIEDEFKPIYDQMMKAGYRFEAEVLRTNEVSITIAGLVENEMMDIDIEIIPQGQTAEKTLELMLKRAAWNEL